MMRHLLRLVWNRRRSNLLLMVEIAISFVVLFAVVTLGVFYADNYGRPLGYQYDRVWRVSVDRKQQGDDKWTPEMVEKTRQLQLALRDAPEIEASAAAMIVPYSNGGMFSATSYEGRQIQYESDEVTDGFADVFGIPVVRGRWFSREDEGQSVRPVVINERLAAEFFGSDDPIGKVLNADQPDHARRVIGVIKDFRKAGEFAAPGNFMFNRAVLDDPEVRPPGNFVLRVRPGTGVVFEEALVKRLQSVTPDWSFEIEPLTDMREGQMKQWLAPLLVVGLVATFLMIMVALGLTGVLWQTVTRRTPEIGLRRVQGATARDIYVQIIGELAVVTTFALVVGTLIVIQLPLLGVIENVSTQVYVTGLVASLAVIYLLTLACGLYPSHLATRVVPVEALRYE